MKTAAICLVTFFLIANPQAALSQDEKSAKRLYGPPLNGPGWEVYKPDEDDDEELEIKKEIVLTFQEELDARYERYRAGRDPVTVLLHTYQRMQAAKEAVHADNKVELIKVAKDVLNRALETEELLVGEFNAGKVPSQEVAEPKAFRLQCELRLLQLDRTEYEKYKQPRSQLRKYIHNMIETAKSSEVFLNLDKYQILGPSVTPNPGENFELRTRVMIYDDSGQSKLGFIFLKAEYDGSEYQTQELYWEFEGKRTNFSVGDR